MSAALQHLLVQCCISLLHFCFSPLSAGWIEKDWEINAEKDQDGGSQRVKKEKQKTEAEQDRDMGRKIYPERVRNLPKRWWCWWTLKEKAVVWRRRQEMERETLGDWGNVLFCYILMVTVRAGQKKVSWETSCVIHRGMQAYTYKCLITSKNKNKIQYACKYAQTLYMYKCCFIGGEEGDTRLTAGRISIVSLPLTAVVQS